MVLPRGVVSARTRDGPATVAVTGPFGCDNASSRGARRARLGERRLYVATADELDQIAVAMRAAYDL
jgi:hypothetical protein